jgi:Ca2+-binding RTX toxin-like protein
LFGQFFDHGLDLVNKGGSGTVYIPLQPDDPLYVVGSNTNFMVLTRATVSAGTDGLMGTSDDVRPVNTTTAFVDQNQTYTSHSSHQVFLRQYEMNTAGRPVATGHLIEGGGAQPGGMATWGEVKAQALLLGIELTDFDVGNVPLLRTDQYGNFIPNAAGFAQIIVGIGTDGVPNTADDVVVSGTNLLPVNPTTAMALRTGHAFLADIAHDAVPVGKIADGDITVGLGNPNNGSTEYDNELLDAHFIAGDGRVNENIGLTAVHSIFHSEHNRLADQTKSVVLADAAAMLANGSTEAQAVAFLNEWLATDVVAVPVGAAAIDALVWDGNRIFQAAKFGTEMQYQHLVFEDFARKIQPNIDFFVVPDGYHADINPSIVAEFAHVVYRFGHSMLNEQIDRVDAQFNPDTISLIEGFLNPIEFDANHTIADSIAAGDIIRGMTRQVGNEIDEFVTGALRNNLLGLPLDLATINLARGRDTGVPSLNVARREFYEASNQAPELKPYVSWTDLAANLKNEVSIINFIAAYGIHPLIQAAVTAADKRAVAMDMVFGLGDFTAGGSLEQDGYDFLNSAGIYANNPDGSTITGVDVIDLWIGGLAEQTMVGGGMLGATFNFVFEVQLQALQDGDRFYYLQRLDGLHLLAEMENNTFAKLISKNADAGHLPSDVFSTPGLILEVDRTKQYNTGLGETAGLDGQLVDDINTAADETADNLGNDPTGGSLLTPLVIRNNPATPGPDANYLRYTGDQHVLLGGTEGNDTLISSEGDDTLYGDGGNDRLEGGQGNDSYIGGDGDDIITDLFGDDIIRSGSGNDAIHAGVGTDLVIADEGNDFVVLGSDVLDETFLGLGNDYVLGSKTTEMSLGGEGNDWIEIGAWTGAVGDNFDDQFAADAVIGHDVFRGDGGFDEFIGEGGDDIWIGTLGRGKFDGMSGFDWATYKDYQFGANADLTRLHFDSLPLPPPNSALDEYSFVEGVSGSAFNDEILGDNGTAADVAVRGARGSVLTAEGIALIAGLQDVLGAGVTSFSSGNILLGGDGSDRITGRGGNDIIDGDKWLNVKIGVYDGIGVDGGVGNLLFSVNSVEDLVTNIFSGSINPGQLRIIREILEANGTGDVDTAMFSDIRANYTISYNVDGTITVNHSGGTGLDGVDTLHNIENMQFLDVLIGSNVAATGAAVIDDLTPTEGSVLTVNTSTIDDGNGLGAFSFQWQVAPVGTVDPNSIAWVNIAGAGAATFVPAQAQVNQIVRVIITFTDQNGNVERIVSAPTGGIGDLFNGTIGSDNPVMTAFDDILNGNDGADILNGLDGTDILNGGAGDDTYILDAVDTIIDASGNDTIQSATTRTLADFEGTTNTIENLTLTGTDNIDGTGNVLANLMTGNTGTNIISGGSNNDTLNGGIDEVVDTLDGGIGDDTYVMNNVTEDTIVDVSGIDTLRSSLTRSLLPFGMIENLTLTGTADINGTGNGLANIVMGNIGTNTLSGGDNNDTLNGGFDAVVDTLNGGAGDDIYQLYSADTDTIVDESGIDVVYSIFSRSLVGLDTATNSIENLLLLGAGNIDGTGNALANVLTGGEGVNILSGGANNDSLNGGSDAVVDTLNGGSGNDTYLQFYEVADDIIDESGTDVVQSFFTRSLAGLDGPLNSIENLVLLGSAAIDGTGNNLANNMFGNYGANTLSGGGNNDTLNGGYDAVVDILNGGTGDDVYVMVSLPNDTILDESGVDAIHSTYTNTLEGLDGVTNSIENLVLLGVTNIDGTGNTLANTMTGSMGTNTLYGLGGNDLMNGGWDANVDMLDGGEGDDTYLFAYEVADTIVDSGGTDVVLSNFTRSIAGLDGVGNSIENLTLFGSGSIDATGNSLANRIIGSSGANVITGGGGSDRLLGGGLGDTFKFNFAEDSALATGIDWIQDFDRSAGDVIDVSGIDADTSTVGDDAFGVLLAAGGTFTAAGQYRLSLASGVYTADFNTDNDAAAESTITIQTGSVFNAGAGWFVV